jgi:general stress protein CsbA
MPVRSSETRRIHSLLGQRRVSDVVMVIILSIALLAGLVGFAVHVLWIVAIVVLALGLGYVVANARQDRREAIDRDREDEERAGRLVR